VEIRFSIAGRQGQIDDQHPLWTVALPKPARRAPAGPGQASTITHGAYFQAIQTYFQNEGALHLRSALAGGAPDASSFPIPERIDVVLEKHGEFYHPARIITPSRERARAFVLNVAVTATGVEWMENETEALRQVAGRLPAGTIPCVYGVGNITYESDRHFCMFLADWFEDCHEFHLSIDPRDGEQKIIVWNYQQAPFFLPPDHAKDVYYKAAYLLTRAYDPQTTRQIYPWHHASGDFILRNREDGVDLKLISVRQYGPTLTTGKSQSLDDDARQMAAMVFFANLTLRNRIDRFDGTGDMAWAGDEVVAPTVAGFRHALTASLAATMRGMLTRFDEDDWVELLTAVVAQYLLMPAEKELLARYTASHAIVLRDVISQVFR
jgi:hypothetical protein